MDKLKPCPYCGNPNVKIVRKLKYLYYVDCGAYACNRSLIYYYESEEDAVKGWNYGERNS